MPVYREDLHPPKRVESIVESLACHVIRPPAAGLPHTLHEESLVPSTTCGVATSGGDSKACVANSPCLDALEMGGQGVHQFELSAPERFDHACEDELVVVASAQADLETLQQCLAKGKHRKTVPEWSSPLEVW